MHETKLTEDQKLDLVRQAIQTVDGWKSLALSINSPEAKERCVAFLRKIGGDKEIEMPVGLEDGKQYTDSMGEKVETVKVKFADLLVQQLEDNIAKIQVTT